jgi:hypothetical protein
MLNRDLKTYIELGKALWADPQRSSSIAAETLSAVSLLDLSEEGAVERASAVLLDRAVKQGMASTTRDVLALSGVGGTGYYDAFFRLQAQERFVLVALHQGRWSYARVARVMGRSAEAVEKIAWRARVQLVSGQGIHPIGASLKSANCPEYDLDRPWTQKFLDEEIRNGTELMFLQNHMMACDSCRQALNRCRDLYFTVEKTLPKSDEGEAFLTDLTRLYARGRDFRVKPPVTFRRSLFALLRQTDIQLLLGFLLFCFIAARFRAH